MSDDESVPARQRLEATVVGRVQGVGFRVFVVRRARAMGVDGWVANTPAGAVDVVAEGARVDLETLLAALQTGPPGSLVERVAARWSEARDDQAGFSIRSGAHRGD